MVLFARTATHADGAHYLAASLERNATGKNHDPAIVGRMNPKKLPSRLAMRCQVLGSDIEGAGGKSLLNRNVYAAQPGPIHTHVSHQIPPSVRHGYVHRLTNFQRLLFGSGNYLSCISECNHNKSSF